MKLSFYIGTYGKMIEKQIIWQFNSSFIWSDDIVISHIMIPEYKEPDTIVYMGDDGEE